MFVLGSPSHIHLGPKQRYYSANPMDAPCQDTCNCVDPDFDGKNVAQSKHLSHGFVETFLAGRQTVQHRFVSNLQTLLATRRKNRPTLLHRNVQTERW